VKALVWTEIEKMVWQEVPDPVLKAGEVLIRTETVGICGSELEGYLGHNSLRVPPMVMGHEFSGRIEAVGEGVDGFAQGQRVTVNPLIYCGQCDRCLRGRYQLCDKRQVIGIHRPGAFGELMTAPAHCVKGVPEHMSPDRVALAEPLACSLRAVRRAFEQGYSIPNVVVFGAGGIGLLCAKAARLLGADRIGIVDTNPERLKVAMHVGAADFTIDARTEDINAIAKSAVGTKGIDVVVDAAGYQPTRSAGMAILNNGGTLMNIGLGIDKTELPINVAIRSEIDILGSFCYVPKDFNDALDWLVSGKITEEGWTEIRSIADGDRAFKDLTSGKVQMGKILLRAN
jgi:threonine dehydrogenase-like Zn-dependent dehydrogenase